MQRKPTKRSNQLLVIVHPGSACGSADMNLGRDLAESQRLDMQMLIEQWQGGVVVIDGELSDELSGLRRSWQDLGRAIDEALSRAAAAGQVSLRRMGDDGSDYDQEDAIRDLVAELKLKPATTRLTLTGAWVEGNGSGCVNSVRAELESLGFKPVVEDAMDLDACAGEDLDEDAGQEDEPAASARAPASTRPRRR